MLWPRDPLREFERVRREMENLFSRVSGLGESYLEFPLVNIYESSDHLTLLAQVPGVNRDDLDINFHRNHLTLSGKRERGRYGSSEVLRQEQSHGQFEKTIRIPFEIRSSEVSASFEDGILKVVMPKSEQARPRQIAIES